MVLVPLDEYRFLGQMPEKAFSVSSLTRAGLAGKSYKFRFRGTESDF